MNEAESKRTRKVQDDLPKVKLDSSSPKQFPKISDAVIDNIKENCAKAFYDRLEEAIRNFEASLNQEHKVGIRLINFGQNVTFHLTKMGYCNPSLIVFYGYTDEGSANLIQHVSQINMLLTKIRREDTSKKREPIGFLSEIERTKRIKK